jgi:hypothetical protein
VEKPTRHVFFISTPSSNFVQPDEINKCSRHAKLWPQT